MKKIILFCALCALVGNSFAQKETYDLTTYTTPKGWKKEVTGNTISYINVNKNTWCRIGIIKSTASKGSIELDFESEWQELIVKNYKPTEAPQLNEVQEADGWKIKAGGAKFIFNNADAMAMLTTMSGFDRCVSIIAVTNSQDYIKDIEALLSSVELIKPETGLQQTPVSNDDKNSIIGTWGKNGSVNPSYNDAYATSIAGYSKDQYTFYSNGTYHFVSKTFGMSFSKILLVKESGTYKISGNNITITPQKSIIEAWSKKDGGDKWGSLLSSQKRTLEKVTYQFTKHYFSGIQIWSLVLQSNTATQRDGPFSSNTTFSNAWYYSPISTNNPLIELPYGQNITTEEIKKEPVQQTATNATEPLVGSWGKSNSVSQLYNRNGTYSYNKQQYTFNANGTYAFLGKNYSEDYTETILIKESGTYSVNGGKLNVVPKTSVIESWSKKNGADNWGQLKSSQKRVLEKATYQVKMESKNLILSISKETTRDGRFSNGNYYSYGPPETFTAIKLPD